MKKFLMAMIVGLIICAGVKVEAAIFNEQQFEKLLVMTVQDADAVKEKNLPSDAATFQKQFNAYMTKFIEESNTEEDKGEMMKEIFLIGDPPASEGKPSLFGKNFLGKNAVIGLIDENGNLKVINMFAAPEDENDSFVTALVVNAFMQGFMTEAEAEEVLQQFDKNSSEPVIKNGIKFSFRKSTENGEEVKVLMATAE